MARFIREGVHTMVHNIEYGTHYPEGITWEEVRGICNLNDVNPPIDDIECDSDDEDEHFTDGTYSLFTLEFTPL